MRQRRLCCVLRVGDWFYILFLWQYRYKPTPCTQATTMKTFYCFLHWHIYIIFLVFSLSMSRLKHPHSLAYTIFMMLGEEGGRGGVREELYAKCRGTWFTQQSLTNSFPGFNNSNNVNIIIAPGNTLPLKGWRHRMSWGVGAMFPLP